MKGLLFNTAILSLAAGAFAFGSNGGKENVQATPFEFKEVPANLKGAFFGDQGLGSEPAAVLNMVKNWGAEFIVHMGDFDYKSDPSAWMEQLNDILGPDYPYFAAIGNHDIMRWGDRIIRGDGYSSMIQNRLDSQMTKNGDIQCSGEYGVKSTCNYKGILLALSGVGVRGDDHPEYLDETLDNPAIWKFCNWHKNQRAYQVGDKHDEVGYEVYETCRLHGAVVSTGHEHSYGRTHLMADFEDEVIANKDNTLVLEPGKSFAFCSGLGGHGIRDYDDEQKNKPHWAATAASDDGVQAGALMCEFNVNGDPRNAHCEFRDIAGRTWDSFNMYSTLPAARVFTSLEAAGTLRGRFIDLQVASGSDDALELGLVPGVKTFPTTMCDSDELPLNSYASEPFAGAETLTAFRFSVPLAADAKIKEARLQFLGAEVGTAPTDISIRIEDSANSASFPCDASTTTSPLSMRSYAPLTVTWREGDMTEDEMSTHTVWTTPEVTELIQHVISKPGWNAGNTMTFIVQGKSSRNIFAYEENPASAASLIIELQ
eukprot:TRINITY_DN1654_c0_g1::TRINITY_DN1654_c0_g1_i2::g.17686::m.17686 TRINITY_DN1654_c0_g1::TRINITY_DN1654_c0_g1_i2::g.17686  ORF type:complete len:553 (+),score=203.65,Metallophos/PF00149.23/0.00074 TRINITY_DN1654_c0_g1_i2:35-1660(+)